MKEDNKELSPEEYLFSNCTDEEKLYVYRSTALEAVRLARKEGEEKLREIRETLQKKKYKHQQMAEYDCVTYNDGISDAISLIDKHLNQK